MCKKKKKNHWNDYTSREVNTVDKVTEYCSLLIFFFFFVVCFPVANKKKIVKYVTLIQWFLA